MTKGGFGCVHAGDGGRGKAHIKRVRGMTVTSDNRQNIQREGELSDRE